MDHTVKFVSFADKSPSCELYHNTSDGICFSYGSIGNNYVFINNSVNIKDLNYNLEKFNKALYKTYELVESVFPVECIDLIFGLMCYNSFPLCDYNSSAPVPRKVSM